MYVALMLPSPSTSSWMHWRASRRYSRICASASKESKSRVSVPVMSGKLRGENAPASALTFYSLSGTMTMEKALDAPTAGMIVNSSELRAAGL